MRLAGQSSIIDRAIALRRAETITISSSIYGYLIFSTLSPVGDSFDDRAVGLLDQISFLSYQVARVFSLDAIEIADISWARIDPDGALAIAAVISLNVLISLGAVRILLAVLAVSRPYRELEIAFPDVFEQRLQQERFPWGTWVDLKGEITFYKRGGVKNSVRTDEFLDFVAPQAKKDYTRQALERLLDDES